MSSQRRGLATSLIFTILTCGLLLPSSDARGATQYLDDGSDQNLTLGTWDLPKSTAAIPAGVSTATGNLGQGYCTPDGTKITRPECLALRIFLASPSSANCTAAGGSWTTGSVCNDTETSQATCEAQPGRLWNAGTGICSVTMKGYNRNKAVCLNLGGTWAAGTPGTCQGNWVMARADTYSPPLFTAVGTSTSAGPGDQCLRCHNSITEWNTNRVRDVEGFLKTGHKNMGRKVTPGAPWAGPDGLPYEADSNGLLFDWSTGTLNGDPVAWIYGDWLAPFPRGVLNKPGQSYTCGRCHMTGWVSAADSTMEPEASFPGIRSNVSVTGSWDQWGITCSRCHASAIEDSATGSCSVANLFTQSACTSGGGTWTAGTSPPAYGTGASHHADVTNFDVVSGGYCTNLTVRNVNKLTCEFNAGTWFSACTDDRWYSATQCVASSGCINPATGHALNYANEAACEAATAGECTNPLFTGQAPCTAGGGTWTAAAADWWATKAPGKWTSSSCSIGGGTCSVAAGNANPDACRDAFGVWTPTTWTDLFSCMDAGGKWTGNKDRRGQLITSLCMQCHRQETGGSPYDGGVNVAGNIKVGPYHGSVEFLGHPQAGQYLNSPHAKFTGNFDQVGTAKYGSGYNSLFQFYGEAENNGNGCTGCHNVHESVVEETGQHHAIHEECTDCHAKNLNLMFHPKGTGTPLEDIATDPAKPCVVCHMPAGSHLFRISSDANYSTFPAAALTATTVASSAPDGTYAQAVWNDIDAACGQCHGGGTARAFAIGGITAGTKTLTVDSALGFQIGQRLTIAGAGNVGSLDASNNPVREDFQSYVVNVVGNQITLAGNAVATVSGAAVEQNAVKNNAPYINKAVLAQLAVDIHNDAPFVTFGFAPGPAQSVNVNASGSSCSGSLENCSQFTWSWGDGSGLDTTSGAVATHVYAAAGSYQVTLTVDEFGVGSDSSTRTVRAYATNSAPTLGGLDCGSLLAANTWVASMTDASVDPDATPPSDGIKQVTMNWGDGTMLDVKAAAASFSHTYKNAAPIGCKDNVTGDKIPTLTSKAACEGAGEVWGRTYYVVTHTAVDNTGKKASETCRVSPLPFSIGGAITRLVSGVPTAVASATVTISGGGITRTVYSAANGTFSVSGLKPGTYNIAVSKSGLTFPGPESPDPDPATGTTVTVGPSRTAVAISAL